MGERVELAVTLAVTGLAGYVGYETSGLLGAEISAIVPAFAGGLSAMRKDNLVTVTEDAAELAGMSGADFVAWINADDRHVTFFTAALEAVWDTLDRHKLRALSYVLADGFQDDARLDVSYLVVKALRELDAPHVRVLALMASAGGIDLEYVREQLPQLSDGLHAIFAALQRTGCLARPEGGPRPPFLGTPPLSVTEFGRTCLEVLRRADSESTSPATP